MKAFLLQLLKFVPVALAVYIVLLIFWGEFVHEDFKKNLLFPRGGGGHMYSRLKEVKTQRDIDILFLGSSHTYHGFDTRIFKEHGWTSFNLGSSSQTPIQTKLLVERYLKRVHPKLVVFEVYPETFQLDGVESSLDIIANDSIRFDMVKMAFGTKNVRSVNTLIYGMYRQLFGRDRNYVELPRKQEHVYISGGYVERDPGYFRYATYDKQEWQLRNDQKAAFEAILKLLKQEQIPYLLIQAPMTSARYRSYTNNAEFDRYIQQKGVYRNFNGELPLDDSLHFYDDNHLNQNGVRIFNAAVISWLEERRLP